MKIVDLLRKGIGFALMSMGVSRPPQKPRPVRRPAPSPASVPDPKQNPEP